MLYAFQRLIERKKPRMNKRESEGKKEIGREYIFSRLYFMLYKNVIDVQ